jgi:hypothetical protein
MMGSPTAVTSVVKGLKPGKYYSFMRSYSASLREPHNTKKMKRKSKPRRQKLSQSVRNSMS